MGKFSTFSFHGTKTLTTGEGGAFLTNDRNLYEHVLTLSNHGRAIDETKQFWPSKIGYKYKMSNIQAALGCAQLERVDELVERKKVIFSCYEEEFNDNKNLRLNPEQVNCVNGYWMTTAQFLGDIIPNIDDLLKNLHDHGISARRVFWPLSETPPFEKASGLKTPVSKHFSSSSINLPSYHDITRDQIAFVAKILRDAIQ
jgi:perosamine synthetase